MGMQLSLGVTMIPKQNKHVLVVSIRNQDSQLFLLICLASDYQIYHPKDHWTLKTGYFEDPTPAIQVQTLPLEGPRSLGQYTKLTHLKGNTFLVLSSLFASIGQTSRVQPSQFFLFPSRRSVVPATRKKSGKLRWQWRWTFWRCISRWTWWLAIAMLVNHVYIQYTPQIFGENPLSSAEVALCGGSPVLFQSAFFRVIQCHPFCGDQMMQTYGMFEGFTFTLIVYSLQD